MASSDLSSLFNQPISPPPPGVTSNLADPNSRASEVYIATGICLPFILSFAALRFYAKTTIMKKMNWDDVTCTLGLLAGISYIAIIVAAVSGTAYGFHLWDITLADFTKEQLLSSFGDSYELQLFLIIEIIYGPCIWLIKLALFVLYLEIFGLLLWLRYLVLTGAFVSGAFYIASMIGFIVMCGPKDGQSQLSYLKALAGPECTRATQLGNAVGVFNVVSDIYLILIPLPAVWSLQMPLRKKVGASAIFLTGLMLDISRLDCDGVKAKTFSAHALLA
ncbi:hypothetical protein MMC07_004985 [Pseudocyphellaria aurata]|nr:hypothetical protein [Pseudocyphellaria aurata]